LAASGCRGGEGLFELNDSLAGLAQSLLAGRDLPFDLGAPLVGVVGVAEVAVAAEFASVPVSAVMERLVCLVGSAAGDCSLGTMTLVFGVPCLRLSAGVVLNAA